MTSIAVRGFGPLKSAELQSVRAGAALVGGAGSGKTALMGLVWSVLTGSASRIGRHMLGPDFSVYARVDAGEERGEYALVRAESAARPLFQVYRDGRPLDNTPMPLDEAIHLFGSATGLSAMGRRAAWVGYGVARVNGYHELLRAGGDGPIPNLEPDQYVSVKGILSSVLGIQDVFTARDPGDGVKKVWVRKADGTIVPFSGLSRGERQAVLVLAATVASDGPIFLEGLDLMDVRLASLVLEEVRAVAGRRGMPVFAETRSAALALRLLQLGVPVYYLGGGEVARIADAGDLARSGAFAGELGELDALGAERGGGVRVKA